MTTKHYSFEAANGTVAIDVVGECRPHLIAKAESDCYAVALYDTERGGYVEATDPESLAKCDYELVEDAADAYICATPEHEDPDQWRIIAREQAFDQGIILGNWHDGKPGTDDLGYFDVMEVQA